MSSSREYLDMDDRRGLSFTAKKGFFVQRWAAVFLLFFFLGALLAVGLLVHYLPNKEPSSGPPQASELSAEDPGSTKVKINVRLPTALIPHHYDLKLQPFFGNDDNFTFNGEVAMLFTCLNSTNNVTVHIHNISIFEETVKVQKMVDDLYMDVKEITYDNERQFMQVFVKEAFEEGQNYTLYVKYYGILNDDMDGFYRSSYPTETGEKKWMTVTQFQPTDARRALPCMDEPGLKATFTVTMVRPKDLMSVSNMPIQRSEPVDANWTADIFQRTERMSTYLLAFMVSDFVQKSDTSQRFNFSVYSRKGAKDQLDYAVKIGPEITRHYETFFNVPYPLPKQDMVALTDFKAGAMENWGLITYRENAVLYDPMISSSSNKQRVATVIAHELAHQWFGNLVTPVWWDDLWLNEGFASYVEFIGVDMVEPTWKMMDQTVILDVHSAMGLDALASSHPISVPVNHPDEINEIFDQISYQKGSSIIRMMANFLGTPTFQKGLTNYLNKFKYGSARQDDLWAELTQAAKENGKDDFDVKVVMDTWTLQTGYPVVNVQRDYENKKLTVSQKRFFLNNDNHTEKEMQQTWWVPITYTNTSKADFTTTEPFDWLTPAKSSLEIAEGSPSGDWVIFNIQETGFYRVNYDTKNWQRLFDQLQNNHEVIAATNRAQMINDALNLARAGEMSYDVALNVTLYLTNERDLVPWQAASGVFSFLDTMLSRSDSFGAFKKYVMKQFAPLYESLKFEELESDGHITKMQRVLVLAWACTLDNPDCVKNAQTKYTAWMNDPNNTSIITPNMKKLITCTVIRNGGEVEWNFAWNRYLNSNVGGEKDALLSAMGCTREPWIISRYLEWSISNSSGIRKQDGSTVFKVIAGNVVGRYIAFNFLRNHWAKIFEYYGSSFFTLSSMIKSVTYSMNTKYELKELHEFARENSGDLGTGRRSVSQALEATDANIKFMEANYQTIETWLHSQVGRSL